MRAAAISGYRSGIDDRSSFFEILLRRLHNEEVSKNIYLESLSQLLFSNILQFFLWKLYGCIIYQYIDLAKLLNGLLNDLFAMRRLAYIAGDQQTLLADLFNAFGGSIRVRMIFAVCNYYIGSFF